MQTLLNHEPEEGRDQTPYLDQADIYPVLAPLSTAVHPAWPLAQLWCSLSGWLIVGLLLVIQFGLFYQFAQREIVWGYPVQFDQTIDLIRSYDTFEHILRDGLLPGLQFGFFSPSPRGTMLYVQASALFLLIGPSRMSALTLNFAYFALFQCMFVWTLRWLTQRWNTALFGLGLLLTVLTPFFRAGGLMDFRIDFIAFCLFGVLACIVIRSRVFISWRWSLVVGAVAVLLILFRLLTIVYLGGIFAVFCFFLFVHLWVYRHDASMYKMFKQELYGVLIAGGLISIITLPFLWYNRESIEAYYIAGHVVSSEKEFRALQVGVYNTIDSILYYPRSIVLDHMGPAFLVLSVLAIGITFLLFRKYKDHTQRDPDVRRMYIRSAYFFFIASALVPYIILTIDVAKSPIVGGIIVPPVLWLILLTVIYFSSAYDIRPTSPVARYSLTGLTILALSAGLYTQFDRSSRHGFLNEHRPDVEAILRLDDAVFNYSRELGWNGPTIFVDLTTDYFDGSLIRSVIYERHGVILDSKVAPGSRPIFPVEPDKLKEILGDSDFALMTVAGPTPSLFPYDRSVAAIRSDLLVFCDQHFIPIKDFHFFNRDVRLYVRSGLKMTGGDSGWVTSDGLTLTQLGKALQMKPSIELRGRTNFGLLKKTPDIQVQLLQSEQPPKTIPATLEISGTEYRIKLQLDPKEIDGNRMAQVHISFDTYFVPKDLGLGSDARRLVIRTPRVVSLQ